MAEAMQREGVPESVEDMQFSKRVYAFLDLVHTPEWNRYDLIKKQNAVLLVQAAYNKTDRRVPLETIMNGIGTRWTSILQELVERKQLLHEFKQEIVEMSKAEEQEVLRTKRELLDSIDASRKSISYQLNRCRITGKYPESLGNILDHLGVIRVKPYASKGQWKKDGSHFLKFHTFDALMSELSLDKEVQSKYDDLWFNKGLKEKVKKYKELMQQAHVLKMF